MRTTIMLSEAGNGQILGIDNRRISQDIGD
jgi:hypothetical protein